MPAQEPEAHGDTAEELGYTVEHGEDHPGAQTGGSERSCLLVQARPVEGSEERAGAVVDEDPGQSDPARSQCAVFECRRTAQLEAAPDDLAGGDH